MSPSPRSLVVDDDPDLLRWLEDTLPRRGFAVTSCLRAADAREALARGDDTAVVITDLNMPGERGIDLCAHVASRWPDVPVIVLTAFGGLDSAVEAIRAGAYYYLTKPIEIEEVARALERAVAHGALLREVKRLRRAVEARPASSRRSSAPAGPWRPSTI